MAVMPGVSWADLAEDDYEMQLMGPPPVAPHNVPREWCMPVRPTKARPVPITPFIATQNQYAVLSALLAPPLSLAAHVGFFH